MSKYTILLVDDEENILRSLKRLLRNERVNVLTARSGPQALRIVQETSIQVLITDNLMPGMKGIELLKKVREISPDTIRIILSGHSDMNAVLQAINEGEAYRFILKPWDDMDLKIAVSIALGYYRLAEENKELLAELRRKERLLDELKASRPDLFSVNDSESTNAGGDINTGHADFRHST